MESRRNEKNIFESGFDSFELDGDFLTRIDSDLRKNNADEKVFVSKDKRSDTKRKTEEKMFEVKSQCSDSFIDDSNDSDFFDFHSKNKKHSLKVVNTQEKNGSNGLCSSGFISCLSPILGWKASGTSKRMNLSSSTPERGKIEKEDSISNSDFACLEAELFDNWDIDDNKKDEKQREKVTLSQALKLLEDAESERQPVQGSLNESIDLLTGEVVGGSVGKLFEESFDLTKTTEKKKEVKESSDEIAIVVSPKIAFKPPKPPPAQKLNFESEEKNHKKMDKDSVKDFCFSSDDDFDFCTQDLIKKIKQVPNCNEWDRSALDIPESDFEGKDSDLNKSSDFSIMVNKKRKCHKIIESDSTDDSQSPKILKQKKSTKQRSSEQNIGREFIDSEAEISDSVEVSSEEVEQDGEFDKSFVDEESYWTQNHEANMTAKYLESVKTVRRLDTFKIPEKKPFNYLNVFSQIPDESNSDYENDSFCIKDDEEEEEGKTDLSDLEIAERILEMDRKKRRRRQKLRKLN